MRIRTRELTRANEELRRINRELHELEAELHEKNRRLARANEELSRKNQELDEFAYVVSHDLQEPLRTLIAFSDFLMKDYGDRLEGEGQEFVRYLVDASRRMRAMILGMLSLSRAGKVIGEFQAVDLDELAAVVRTDLGELIRSKNAEVRIASPLPVVWGDPRPARATAGQPDHQRTKIQREPEPRVEIGVISRARPRLRRTPASVPIPAKTPRSPSRTTGSASIPSSTRRSSSSSGGCTPGRSSRARVRAWPSAARSSRPTAGGSGWRASPAEEPLSSSGSVAPRRASSEAPAVAMRPEDPSPIPQVVADEHDDCLSCTSC